MGMTPAEVLSSSRDYEDFKEKIIALRGDFPFDAADMLDLGRVYFIRYPDTSDNRNMYNISTGYRIVRLCVLEKVLLDIDEAHRPLIHDMLDDMTLIETVLARLYREMGIEGIEHYRSIVTRNLDSIKAVIDELPRGMIKERFIGGISKFYNEMYLVKNVIEHLKTGGGV
ncbi:MAG TPA: hypothetical protein PKN50_17130 [Spirochaetota bacterium]|nr:hypothetical protein [Spirochaetota bacterium]HPV40191.1 hypothetical protein [Spirochaetota bacterium]